MYHERTRCYQNKKDLFLTDFKSKKEFKKSHSTQGLKENRNQG